MGVKVRYGRGAWWVVVHHGGTRKVKRVGVSKATAELIAAKVQVALAEGRLPFPEPPGPATMPSLPTFRQAAEQWLATYPALAGLRRARVEGYERALKLYAYPRFGDKFFIEVSREDIRQLVAEMVTAGRSRDLIRNVVAPIRGTFNEAIEAGLRLPNPAARIGRYLRDRDDLRRRIDPLTAEEEAWFLATARNHYPRHYPMFLCALRTGLRLGEFRGLQWGDLDYQDRFIEVRRSLEDGGRIERPKSGKIRRVDISLGLAEDARAPPRGAREGNTRQGLEPVPEWVFCNQDGPPHLEVQLRAARLPQALSKADLRRIRFHDLRHTFASRLIQNGESLAYVKDQIGHHSIKVTVDIYGKLVPGANKAAVDRLEQTAERLRMAQRLRNPRATGRHPRGTNESAAQARGHVAPNPAR